jgi:glycosyltransferase involved in cell wall biosynthesis
MPEACILITVYNGAAWIDEALDSALAQRGADVEILVVDDGSTDATPEILRRRAAGAPGRIRVLSIEHSNRSQARNVGIDHVEAEFVTLLDADDRMHPLRVKLECDALRAHPDAALSFSARWSFEDGSDVGAWEFTPGAFRALPDRVFTRVADAISTAIAAGECPGTNACTWRTRWVRECGRFNPAYEIYEDVELWLRCLHDTPVVYVAAPLYQRRLHPAATSAERSTSAVERALFTVMDAAHADWSRYSPAQRAHLSHFEQGAGVWLARCAAVAEGPAAGIAFLIRHERRLRSLLWWRTLAFLLAPPFVRSAWRRWRPGGPSAASPKVPLAEAMTPDPTRIWVPGATRSPEE